MIARSLTLAGSIVPAFVLLVAPARAQVYVGAPGNIPSGAPGNNSASEQVDFADVDLDGDWDAAFADGGDLGNDQNRLWINLGGLQAGTPGFFVDETAARLPVVSDTSRDLEFVDFDADGDPDVYVVNTASIVNQGGRWWTNQGGAQAGAAGFYVDETATRWVGLGGSGSSIPPALVLAGGGYITWAQEQVFADLDADGDLDLVAATIGGAFGGQEPTRVFLNDGAGSFSEFNPSGVQLTSVSIPDGTPGLWAQGTQQGGTSNTTGAFCDIAIVAHGADVGDLEGDFDVDLLLTDFNGDPRVFRNLSEGGPLAFRDVTGLAFPGGWGGSNGKYEAELGDLDGDDDLDLYGVSWAAPGYGDLALRNSGAGVFEELTPLAAGPGANDDADFVDYDADGDLDVYLANFSGNALLLRNDFAGGPFALSLVPGAIAGAPAGTSLDVDLADVDLDGDLDAMQAVEGPNGLLLNVLDQPDAVAPRIPLLEQPADHAPTGLPTRIRAHVLDNAPDYVTGANATALVYSVDGGPFQSAPMRWSGAQVFRGELPATALGNVRYRVLSTDGQGNVGASTLKSLDTAGGCSGSASTYCAAKLNSDGCLPRMGFEGAPSASAGFGFQLRVDDLVPGNNGLYFYSKSGPAEQPFQGGLLCVAAPVQRTPVANSGGSGTCGGSLALDFNAWIASGSDPALVAGASVWIQVWSRDPAHPTTTSLSDAATFSICP